MSGVPVGFALARTHARHAQRPGANEWRRLDGVRTASQYLQYARQTGLRFWLRTVGEDQPQAEVELKLRAAFRGHALEVAGWLPAAAAPAARLIADLPDLPALDHLHRGGAPQAWMNDEPRLADALENPLTAPPYEAWMTQWLRLGPRRGRSTGRLGNALRDLVIPGQASPAAARLHWIFRNRTLDAAGVYAYLGLVLDDIRRLAGGLARRRPGESRHLEAA